jgi:hypothetical protein
MISNNKICAIVVGAGAVKNAWNPVIRALQQYHDFSLTPDGANSFLARVVYLLRWYASDNSEFGKEQLRLHLDFLNDIKVSISKELKDSQRKQEITVRENYEEIINKFLIPYGNKFMLITTNWENVASDALHAILNKKYKCELFPLHLHGSIDNSDTLYLPSEMTKEPYRTTEDEQHIGGMHGSVWRGLEKAHRVIVYGLSIDPLDAELGQTLACGWSNKCLEEIIIINPSHENVAHRVNLLLDRKRDIKITGYSPDKLNAKHDYTITRHKANK